MGRIDDQQHVEQVDIALGILLAGQYPVLLQVVRADLADKPAVAVVPEITAPRPDGRAPRSNRVRRRRSDLVDIDSIHPDRVLQAVHQPDDLPVPNIRRGAGHRIEDFRRGVNLGIERTVGFTARRVVTAVALIAVGRRIPEPAVDIGRHTRPQKLGVTHHPCKTLLCGQVIGIVGIVGVMMPEIPVHTQPLPEIPGGTPDGIVRLVGHMLGTHPRVGIVTPLRDIARGERLAAPFGREGKRTVPPDNGIFPTLRRETRDRDPRQAERPVRDPSGRSGNGIAQCNRRRRTLRRIGLSAAAAVFRPVIEGTLGIVYHEELHQAEAATGNGFERSDVERLLDAPASVVMILPSSGRSITTFGEFQTVTSHPAGRSASMFHCSSSPPSGSVTYIRTGYFTGE